MKKILSVILILALVLSFSACAAQGPEQLQTKPTYLVEWPTVTQEQTTVDATSSATDLPPQPTDDHPSARPSVNLPEQNDPDQEDPSQSDTPQPSTAEPTPTTPKPTTPKPSTGLDVNGSYTSKNDVALYLRTYGRLPSNFVTKSQAKSLYGWKSGSLAKKAPGMCIGGDRFYNNEGLLPDGYVYYECDIDTMYNYSSRGSKRLVFTYTGIIYYTSDHYESFTLLYGG